MSNNYRTEPGAIQRQSEQYELSSYLFGRNIAQAVLSKRVEHRQREERYLPDGTRIFTESITYIDEF